MAGYTLYLGLSTRTHVIFKASPSETNMPEDPSAKKLGDVDAVLLNALFWGNRAGRSGDQIFNDKNLINSLSRTVTITDCLVEAGCPADVTCTNVIDANPLFLDPDGVDNILGTIDDDLRLLPGSPAIDAGDNAHLPPEITTDLAGNPRIVDGDGDSIAVVDIGAFEIQSLTVPLTFTPAPTSTVTATATYTQTPTGTPTPRIGSGIRLR